MANPSVSIRSLDASAGVQLEFDTLLNICAKLSEPRPVVEILNELLLQARRLVRAEAGTVFIVEDDRLRFVCCQNDARPDLCVAPKPSDLNSMSGLKGATVVINEASLAGYAAYHSKPLKIDDAYRISAQSGYRFDKTYDKSTGYRTRSLLVTPLLDREGKAVGVLQLINHNADNGTIDAFSKRDDYVASALASIAAISVRNAKLHDALRTSRLDTIMRLSTAAEFRDDDTGQHIRRVSMYCETIARTLGHPHEFTQLMLFASPMHDIGKLAIPDAILAKPGKLTDEERRVMQQHTLKGAEILQGGRNELLSVAERIARSHHERWDGKGYPYGLSGDKIPLEGRMTAVADVFDALVSKRVYKPAFTVDRSLNIIAEERGNHFDPQMVDAFNFALDEIKAIHDAYQKPAGNDDANP